MDPVLPGPQPQEMFHELNDLLNQANEDEEDDQVDEEALNMVQDNLAQELNAQHTSEVNVPVLNEPAQNFLLLEIQEDDLMGDEERSSGRSLRK